MSTYIPLDLAMFYNLRRYPAVAMGKSAASPASCTESSSILVKRASTGSSKTIVARVEAFAFTSVHDPIVGPSDDNTLTLVGYLEQM